MGRYIQMNFREICCEAGMQMQLSEDCIRWHALLLAVLNPWPELADSWKLETSSYLVIISTCVLILKTKALLCLLL